MTDTNTKLRAVFLAAIMFMWLFAGTVAFAGSAGAQFNEEGEDMGADGPWDTAESTAWQGQQLYFQAQPGEGETSLYRVRTVDSEATDPFDGSDTVANWELGQGEAVVIDTSDFEGEYVITRDARRSNIVETDEQGVEESTHEDVVVNGDNLAIDFLVQDLSTEFAVSTVELGETTTLEIGGNRGGYDLLVTEDNLTQAQLENVFDTDERVGDDSVLIEGVSRTDSLEATFSDADFDEGDELNFQFDVADSTASDSAAISVGEAIDATATFSEAQYTQERGDIVTFAIDTEDVDAVNVTFGGEGINYEATLEVEPNDDGEIVVQMNTWLASRTTGDELGDLELDSTDVFTAVEGTINEDNVSESPTDRNRVLDAGLYDLVVEEVNFDDEPVEYDVSVVNLGEPQLEDFIIHTHPNQGFSELDGDVGLHYDRIDEGMITESDEIAVNTDADRGASRGDGIVHALGISGVYGMFDALDAAGEADTDAEALAYAIENDLISLDVEQTNPGPNEDPNELASLDNFQVNADAANNTVFVNVRSDQMDTTETVALGDEYNVTFTAEVDFLNQFLRTRNHVETGESLTDEFTLVDREAEFDTTDVDGEDVVLVPADEDAEISGATSVAPGTSLNVRARATGEAPFLMTERVTVDDDGTFSAEFDFSAISEGQEFTASIQRQSFAGDAATPGLVGEVEEETPTPTPTPEDDDEDPTPTPEEDDDDPPEDDTDDQAGFGAVVALIALLAAALIAARRHSFDN